MKECWINVYSDGLEQWQGFCYDTPFMTSRVIYRIHVRLK